MIENLELMCQEVEKLSLCRGNSCKIFILVYDLKDNDFTLSFREILFLKLSLHLVFWLFDIWNQGIPLLLQN